MKTRFSYLVAFAFLFHPFLVADEPAVKDSDARAAISQFKKNKAVLDDALEKVFASYRAKYREALAGHQTTLVNSLKERMDAATRNALLDEALTIRAALEYFGREELVEPDEVPETKDNKDLPEPTALRKKVEELQDEIRQLNRELASTKEKIPLANTPGAVVGTWSRRGLVYVLNADGSMLQVRDGIPVEGWTGKFRLLDGKVLFLWDNGKYHFCELVDPNTLAHPPYGNLERVNGTAR